MAGQRIQPERVQRGLAYAWVAVLSAAILAPALAPGFALSYDLVFTPRQDLLPGSIGVGSGLPRAVPQDAIVALAETVIPGWVLEKLALIAVLMLAGTGMLVLLRSTSAGVIAATFAIANPFVAQRLVIGHWGFLLAYALIPWALIVTRRLRVRGDPWDGLRLLLIVAAGSLTPTGSLVLAAVAVPAALLPGSSYPLRLRAALVAGVAATWLPWLVPALLHPSGAVADPDGTGVFALRADVPGGAWLSALTGGGIWNADVVVASRSTPLSWLFAAAVLALAAWGARGLAGTLGRVVVTWWSAVAFVGFLGALASIFLPGPWEWLLDAVPGGGLARDAHKLLAPWVLLLAAAAGEGGRRVAEATRDRASRSAIVIALAIVPIACQPDILLGVGGRLEAVEYPADWAIVREILEADSRPGDVASFPWTAFRRYEWNQGRTVLDPAPRWLPRTTVVSDTLTISTSGGIVEVSGEDSRALAISETVQARRPLLETLPSLGIGWVLVAKRTPGPPADVIGWDTVFDGPDLALYAAPGRIEALAPPPHLGLVAVVDLAVLGALLSGLLVLGFRRVRARSPAPLVR